MRSVTTKVCLKGMMEFVIVKKLRQMIGNQYVCGFLLLDEAWVETTL